MCRVTGPCSVDTMKIDETSIRSKSEGNWHYFKIRTLIALDLDLDFPSLCMAFKDLPENDCPASLFIYTSHRHKLSFFDGRLDDNNMMDVTTEMIPFALNRGRKERKAQFMPVSSIVPLEALIWQMPSPTQRW